MTTHAAAALFIAAALSASAAAQRESTGIVRGRVVAADTEAPVRKARVALTPEGAAATEPIYTDADGRFEFTNLAPGRYTLAALKAGYVVARFGARTQFDRTTNISVAAGAVVDGLELRVVKGAVIAGRIVDAAGEPMVGALVNVGRIVKTDGRLQFRTVGTPIDTDDLGDYRIAGLAAGSYVLAVSQAGGGVAPRALRTFYPGTPYLTQARTIPLRAGEIASATDLTILPVQGKLVQIAGYVTDADGSPVTGRLTVVTTGDGVAGSTSATSMQLPPTGEFNMQTEPGHQTLIAHSEHGAALQRLIVDSDVTGLRLVLTKPGRISGRVFFNGAPPPPGSAIREVRIAAWNADLDGMNTFLLNGAPAATPVKPDGAFALENLVGRQELRVTNVPRGWFVAATVHEGRQLLNVPFELKSGEHLSGVQIFLTDKPTELSGLVLDRQQRTITDCSVLVFAEDRAFLPGRARWIRPDSSGRFNVEGLPAGTYLATAVADVDDVEWATVEYLDRLRGGASRVTLADGETKTITLEWPGTP